MRLGSFSALTNANLPDTTQRTSVASTPGSSQLVERSKGDGAAISREASERETESGWNAKAFEEGFGSLQGEEAGPQKGNGLMATLEAYCSDARKARALEDQAFASKDRANLGMEKLHRGIVGLPKDDQKALGQSMFYKLAAASGLSKTADQRNMTAQQIREKVASLSPEARQEFEKNVKAWAASHQIPSQIAMSEGAVDWAARSFDKNAPAARNRQLLGIAQSGKQVWDANNTIVNNAVELNKVMPGKGTGLYSALNSPADSQ
jgi:hypothetical protein